MKILLLNGPNLNLLGKREPEIYGHTTLQQTVNALRETAESLDVELMDFQSNSESALIERVHAYFDSDDTSFDGIIINPGAFTHTSIALRDALSATGVPFVEVHLSNVHSREPFRHHSYFSDVALGVIVGLGHQGYHFAFEALIKHLVTNTN